MMHAAAINTIRTYEPMTDPRILDLLLKYHLRTIVPIGANCKMGLYDFTSTIAVLKNHLSTLFWEIGNAWNHNYFYSNSEGGSRSNRKPLDFKECVDFVQNVSACIKIQDRTHPISTGIADIPKEHNELKRLFKSVDLCGMNVFDGLTFGDRLEQWKALTDKPLYLAECGADSYNELTHSYHPQDQAKATRCILTEMINNLSSKNKHHLLLGGCLFEWNDEWWKAKAPNESLDAHITGGFETKNGGPYPDHFANEEWWGVLTIYRDPRPAYEVMKELFTSTR